MTHSDIPVKTFKLPQEWRNWLSENYTLEKGIWVKFYKKASGIVALTYKEALNEAFCFGWIDSLVKRYDNQAYIQKFTPQKSKKSMVQS